MPLFPPRQMSTRSGTAAKYLGDSRVSVTLGPDSDKPGRNGLITKMVNVERTLQRYVKGKYNMVQNRDIFNHESRTSRQSFNPSSDRC